MEPTSPGQFSSWCLSRHLCSIFSRVPVMDSASCIWCLRINFCSTEPLCRISGILSTETRVRDFRLSRCPSREGTCQITLSVSQFAMELVTVLGGWVVPASTEDRKQPSFSQLPCNQQRIWIHSRTSSFQLIDIKFVLVQMGRLNGPVYLITSCFPFNCKEIQSGSHSQKFSSSTTKQQATNTCQQNDTQYTQADKQGDLHTLFGK